MSHMTCSESLPRGHQTTALESAILKLCHTMCLNCGHSHRLDLQNLHSANVKSQTSKFCNLRIAQPLILFEVQALGCCGFPEVKHSQLQISVSFGCLKLRLLKPFDSSNFEFLQSWNLSTPESVNSYSLNLCLSHVTPLRH